jgi:hypothetical protein
MPDTSRNQEARDYAERIRRHIPHHPKGALELLPQLGCAETRLKLASLIAQSWARTDINTAWNAVARSSLSAKKKQLMFNELWG